MMTEEKAKEKVSALEAEIQGMNQHINECVSRLNQLQGQLVAYKEVLEPAPEAPT